MNLQKKVPFFIRLSGVFLVLAALVSFFFGIPYSAPLLLVGLAGMHATQVELAGGFGWLGVIGVAIGTVGISLWSIFLARMGTVPDAGLFSLGYLSLIFYGFGFVILGISIERAGVFPRYSGWLMGVGVIIALFLVKLASLVFYASWVWIGVVMVRGRYR